MKSKPTFEEAMQLVKLELVSNQYASISTGSQFFEGATHGVAVVLGLLDYFQKHGACARSDEMKQHWSPDETPRREWKDEDWKLHPRGKPTPKVTK